MVAGVELTYDSSATALAMANLIFGGGGTVNRATYTGDPDASAIYSDGDLAPGVVPSETGVILSTGEAQGFTRNNSTQSNVSSGQTTANSGPSDADFNALAGTTTNDASFLEVVFTPDPGVTVMTIDFVFSSEEYPEYVNSIYNDLVGVWVNDNPVTVAVGDGSASVSNISDAVNENLYVDNTGDQFNTEMDGFTITMSVTFTVVPEQENTIKIGVADVADSAYDSNLLIAANSFQGLVVAQDDLGTIFPNGTRTVDVLANDVNETAGTLEITKINGVDVNSGDTVNLPGGQSVTLNADGTITFNTDGDVEDVAFTYEVTSTTGESDTGYVSYGIVPCFTAGTLIATPVGDRKVETLKPGDLVLTEDEGPQPLRWVGQRSVPATGPLAPIRIAPDSFGSHGEILVSPLHRILVRGPLAELYFGDEEVLVAAKDLVNGRTVRRVEGGTVDYVHLLFDRHQVIQSNGLRSESFLPGSLTGQLFETEAIREICSIFPELDPETGSGYGPAARRMLKAHEAGLLMRAA